MSAIKSGMAGVEGLVRKAVPETLRATMQVWTLGLLKIPMLLFASPQVVELTDERCVVKIPLNRRTRNHLGSMYFGALAVGADCAGGLIAWRHNDAQGGKLALVFKDFHAEFLKRPEGDTLFTCEEGAAIRGLVERALASGQREELPVHLTATCPSKTGDEPVARFMVTVSLKKKGQ